MTLPTSLHTKEQTARADLACLKGFQLKLIPLLRSELLQLGIGSVLLLYICPIGTSINSQSVCDAEAVCVLELLMVEVDVLVLAELIKGEVTSESCPPGIALP
jgi:hypothetical protein